MEIPEKLYEGNMRKNYLLFAIPLIISALLSQSYSFINSIMIGKFIGSEAFAATAVTADLIELINAIFHGYLTGIGIYVAILFGKNEYGKMLNIIKFNFILTSALAIIISVICNVFLNKIFDILNVNNEIYSDAEFYFRVYVLGYLIMQLNWGFTYIATGVGLTKLQLIISVITGVINVLLNYIFLAVMNKGIGFSALATIIAVVATTVIYIYVILKLFKNMGINLHGFIINREMIKNSFGFGSPTMLQQMAMYACTTLVSPLVNTCTTAALSGYAVANKARALICTIYQNSAKANTTFVAQAMGAEKIDKVKKGIRIGTTQGLIFFTVAMSIFMIFAKKFTALFLDPAQDAESFLVSVNTIRYLFPFIAFNVFNNLFHGIFRAVGSGVLMVVSTLIYAVSYVIYAYIVFAILPNEMKIYGVHIALGGAYITEVTFAAIIYFTGKWKSPLYKELELKEKNKIK